jgi:hypothetical protein
MKQTVKCLILACLFCVLQGLSPAVADDGLPPVDQIVGYWLSSSGTPLTIAFSGKPNVAWLSINGGPNIDLHCQDRFGTVIFYYKAPGGEQISGSYDSEKDIIEVSNAPERTFEAQWRRQ